MAKILTHIKDCEKILGNGFKEIHEYLDSYAKKYNPMFYLEYHRQFLHNDKTVQEILKTKGFYAAQAAKLHIIRDNALYVYFNIDTLREDDIERLYQQALKFCHKSPEDK
jgi:hypothetical protein